MLWDDLKTNHDFQFLLTFRLNQDCVENLFSQVRCNTANIDRPTPSQFRVYMARVMVNRIFAHPKNSNCEDDGSLFMLSLNDIINAKEPNETEASTTQENVQAGVLFNAKSPDSSTVRILGPGLKHNVIADINPVAPNSTNRDICVIEDYSILDQIKINVLEYIAGYISSKLTSKLCSKCKSLISDENSRSNDDIDHFIHHKSFDCKTGLVKPSKIIINVVTELEQIYITYSPLFLTCLKVKHNLLQAFRDNLSVSSNIFDIGTCQTCDVLELVMCIFLNIRLHFTLKENNNNFQMSVKKKKSKKTLHFSHD